MKVTFIGTADGHTSKSRNHSGILVETLESTLLFDCGASMAPFLLKNEMSSDVPAILWISHMHSDHVGQFPMFIQSLWLRGRHAPLHVYAPKRACECLKSYLEQCLLFPELIGFAIEWHPVQPGKTYRMSPFTFQPFATTHLHNLSHYFKPHYPDTCFDCFGAIWTYENHRFVYSADLASPDDLKKALNKPTRGLFCELTHFPEKDLFAFLAKVDLDEVWITHYSDRLMRKQSMIQKLAKEQDFKGRVHLMDDLSSVTLSKI